MGKIPNSLRENIARNIRECRLKNFPGRGGGKRCAEAFGVSPQQWSPWESGKRTPDELRLEQIANFFGTTVEWFRRDHRNESLMESGIAEGDGKHELIGSHTFGTGLPNGMDRFPEGTNEESISHYLWLIDLLTRKLTGNGIKVTVTFEHSGSVLPGA